MAFEHLKVKPLQRATSSWANSIVDALNQLYDIGQSTIKYYDLLALGYDIIPDQDNVRKLGDPERAWKEVNAHYGYFKDEVYVQGKKVIKDEDPVNIYDIFEPAKQKLVESINSSKVPSSADVQQLYDIVAKEETQEEIKKFIEEIYGIQSYNTPLIRESVERIEEKIVKLQIDEYGRLGVIISEPIDEYGRVKTSPRDVDEDLIPATGIIDTSTQTSPVEIITPSPGKRIDIRRAYVSTDSTSGKVYVKFKNSGKIITAIYPTKYGFAVIPAIRIPGDVDEPVIIEWEGLDSGSEITFAINYKEI